MTAVRARIEIDAPAADVWRRLVEFRHWPEWGPSVRAVEAEGDAEAVAMGVRGRVQTALWLWLPFEITSFDEGCSWSWTVAGIEATGHRVTALSPMRTAVEFSVRRRFAPYVFVLDRGLRNLKAIVETA